MESDTGYQAPERATEPATVASELYSVGAILYHLLAGHEPTWSRLVSLLAGGGTMRMVTAAVACLEISAVTWDKVLPGRGELLWLVTPRLLDKTKTDRTKK